MKELKAAAGGKDPATAFAPTILFHQSRKAHFGSDPAKPLKGKHMVIRRGGLREDMKRPRLGVVSVNRLEFQSAAPGREAGSELNVGSNALGAFKSIVLESGCSMNPF
jgi:hypothetical protein